MGWHVSAIEARMIEWQRLRMIEDESRSRGVCHSDGEIVAEVLFCDLKVDEEQEIAIILDKKMPLVKAWYEHKHGLNRVCFRWNRRGTLLYMRFGFHSADAEA